MSTTIKALEDYPDISFIDDYTLEQLNTDMLAWFLEKRKDVTGQTIVLGEADDRKLLLMAAAYYMYHLYELTDFAGKMNMLKYSQGDFLENLGAASRISRNEATGATTTLRFSMESARTSATGIPEGSRVTAGDGVYFATDEYAEIPVGSLYVDVRATCTAEGTSGNGYAIGELSHMMDIVPYIDSVENITESEGGQDLESDESLRNRIFLSPDSYTDAGSKGGYEYWTRQFDSNIIDVKVSTPELCEGEIRVLLTGGELPGAEFLSSLEEYLENNEIRKMNDHITALAPTAVSYSLNLTYYISESDKSKAGKVQSLVNDAVADYILWQKSKIGRDINPDELIQRIKAAGAKRVVIASPGYTVINNESVAVCQSQTITYGGLEDD